jgi:triacylglycerol lipase
VNFNNYSNGILVHQGFYSVYNSIRQQLFEWWNQYGSNIKYLYLTGHSLGGATSTLCAFDFGNQTGTTSIVHYALASPRVGNPQFAQTFDQVSPYSIRVANTEDLVTNLPLAQFDGYTYEHVCITRGLVSFTKSLGSIKDNHIQAYDNLPICFQNVAPC